MENKLKTEALTFLKEDILALGRMVDKTVEDVEKLLRHETDVKVDLIDEREEQINDACQAIEEKCLDLLLEKQALEAKEVRALVGSTAVAAKFERIADHAHRVGRMAIWADQDKFNIPPQLAEMAGIIHRMMQDVLLSFVTDDAQRAQEVVAKDSQVNYLHDVLSKQLLSDLGAQTQEEAQMRAQFLFCARFLERMGDACVSVARKIYFIVTGRRIKKDE